MREVYIVRPYCDGPIEVFTEYSTAFLRKCELHREYGGMAVLDTYPIQENKLAPTKTPTYGPSAVSFLRNGSRA